MGWLSSLIIQFKGFEPPFLPSCRTSVLDLLTDGGSVQQPTRVEMDVIPSPNQGTREPPLCSSFPGHAYDSFLLRGTSRCCGTLGLGFLSWYGGHLLWRNHTFKHCLIWGEVTLHLILQLLYTLLTGMASLHQADRLFPPNTGGLRHTPPSSLIAFLRYLDRQRWNWVVAGSSSWEDMAVQVGPDGNSPSCIAHSPF